MTPAVSYSYRAARRSGAVESGVVEAASREAASALLGEKGLFPMELALRSNGNRDRASLPPADLALGLRVLATLLEAGLPIARALAAMPDLAPESWRRALDAIQASVRDGQSLGAALGASSLNVPPVVLGIVHAGEAGSGLAAAVRRAAELMESAAAIQAAVRSALAYPILLALAGAASVGLLVGVVLPRFAVILADLGQALPPTTRFVLTLAAVARAGAIPALLAFAVVVLVWRAWVSNESGRAAWHASLLRLPLLGTVRRSAATARTSAALAALAESGVPVATALLHGARASGDSAIGARLLAARERVLTGERISSALAATEAMTATAIRLVRAGEETGKLAAMLNHAARLESERAETLVKGAVRLLEPAMIVIFGGMVAVVAAALLQAIYSVRPGG